MQNLSSRLRVYVRTGIPVLLWGPPGVGKTATVLALARSLRLPVETVIASIHEPSDFNGLPVGYTTAACGLRPHRGRCVWRKRVRASCFWMKSATRRQRCSPRCCG